MRKKILHANLVDFRILEYKHVNVYFLLFLGQNYKIIKTFYFAKKINKFCKRKQRSNNFCFEQIMFNIYYCATYHWFILKILQRYVDIRNLSKTSIKNSPIININNIWLFIVETFKNVKKCYISQLSFAKISRLICFFFYYLEKYLKSLKLFGLRLHI